MLIIGVFKGVVEIFVSINPEQLEVMRDQYPEHILLERSGDEDIGWVYDGSVFYLPTGAAPVINTHITRLAFLNRFTDTEAVGIDLASIGATVPAATLRRAMKRIDAAQSIDLANSDLVAGVAMLEASGLIAAGRSTEILTTPPTASEVFTG
jgi:hypothetical protein